MLVYFIIFIYSGLMFSLLTLACWLSSIRVFGHFELHCWATFDNVDFNFSTFLFRFSSSWDFSIFPFIRFSSLLFCFNLNCRLHSLFFSFLLFMRSSFSWSIRGSCFKKTDIQWSGFCAMLRYWTVLHYLFWLHECAVINWPMVVINWPMIVISWPMVVFCEWVSWLGIYTIIMVNMTAAFRVWLTERKGNMGRFICAGWVEYSESDGRLACWLYVCIDTLLNWYTFHFHIRREWICSYILVTILMPVF